MVIAFWRRLAVTAPLDAVDGKSTSRQFTGQSSLFATLIYRYEATFQGEVRPPGSFNSGCIEFLSPCGQGLFSDMVYDLRITSMDSPNRHANLVSPPLKKVI